MGKQGYPIKYNVHYEDNQIDIFMLKNGGNSSTGISVNVHIRFFVKDRVNRQKIRVEYCSSNIMLTDFFAKILHGYLFESLRDVLMGYAPSSLLSTKNIVNQGGCWKS